MRALSASMKMTVILTIAMGLVFGGCKKKGNKSKSKRAKAGMASLKVGKGKKKLKKLKKLKNVKKALKKLAKGEKAKLKKEEYKRLTLALETCKLKKLNWDYKCPAYLELQKVRKEKKLDIKDFSKWQGALALEILKNKAPTLRWRAVSMMSSAWAGGMKEKYVKAIIAAGEKEKNVGVLRFMLDAMDSNQKKHPVVGEFIIKNLSHENEDVRLRAVWSLAAWGKDTKGAAKAMVSVIKTDKVKKVQQAACEGAGKLEDESVLKTLKKLTLNKKTDPDLYYYCFKGVIQMWTGYPFHPKKPSKKAYQLTLQLLKQGGRTDKRPPWGIAGMFNNLYKESDKRYKKWAETAKWYKKKDLVKAIGAVIKDLKAGWMIRTYLVKTAAKLGAEKKYFQKLLKAYKGNEKKHPHSLVTKAISKRI
jgi:HEAT repeats